MKTATSPAIIHGVCNEILKRVDRIEYKIARAFKKPYSRSNFSSYRSSKNNSKGASPMMKRSANTPTYDPKNSSHDSSEIDSNSPSSTLNSDARPLIDKPKVPNVYKYKHILLQVNQFIFLKQIQGDFFAVEILIVLPGPSLELFLFQE